MPQFLVTEPGEEARRPKRDSTTNTWEKFKVRNARRPTLQDVAGGEISLERYRASARSQSHARQPTLQDVENGEISLEKYRASARSQSNARRPTLRTVENGEISSEQYRASASAQSNARRALTLTP